ncbi:hypothetical protein KOR34_08120 [Posidoniimonas corsicana]|uniref:Uncharacterized protein n=2 Tax=Posidoniimonas corsicana TaxID=1938618 RepID=A0A5C5VE18_9BACT|nr:hypothetical protein KOR34_08120 [Posidoniimonas corsicana]
MSLVELSVAMLIAAVLLAGMSAPLRIALEASDDDATPERAALQSAKAVADFANEFQYAIDITEQQPRSCTFTVADRGDADSAVESIRYAWSNVPGAPLTRSVNGEDAAVVVEDVQTLQFSYYVTGDTVNYVRYWIQCGADSRAAMESIVRPMNPAE